MQARVTELPLRFFEETPAGRVLNRFSKDAVETDEALTSSATWCIMSLMRVASILAIVVAVQPALGLAPPPPPPRNSDPQELFLGPKKYSLL
jgi:ABC-type bacteriocin/lantibiotic exporter with double-glycine peptidase domain